MEQIYGYYRSTRDANLADAKEFKRKIHLAGTLRFVVVATCIAALIIIKGEWPVYAAIVLAGLAPLIALVTWGNRLAARKAYAERMGALCEAELKGLDYDFSAFGGAGEKADPAHPFTTDLDVFGDRSLFQSINRTVTSQGTDNLAEWFRSPLHDRDEILGRQAAVRELSGLTPLRQHFCVTGRANPGRLTIKSATEHKLLSVSPSFPTASIKLQLQSV